MPRSISGPLASHIAQTTTTLSMCWQLTRTDGTIFRYTNNNKDVVLTGVAGKNGTYEAIAAFDTTSFVFTANLSPSRVQLDSVVKDVTDATLTAVEISKTDLRCGLFNDALLEIFLVNYEDISQGIINLMKGNWGDIKLTETGFETTVRSLAERLRRDILDLYSPECRVDLFSAKCGLAEADFLETSFVDTVVSQRLIDLPTGKSTLTDVTNEEEGQLDDGVIWAGSSPAVLRLVKVTATADGTPRRPFLIANTTDLNNIRNNIYAYYELTTDIDMVAFGTWTPIPDFKGGLDGRGFKIENVDSDLGASATPNGLFQTTSLGSVIRRLGIEGSDWRGATTTVRRGSFVGTAHGGLIIDCYAFNNTLDGEQMGGIAGSLVTPTTSLNRGGAIVRCWAANIMGTGTATVVDNGLVVGSLSTPPTGIPYTMISCYGDNLYSQNNGGIQINSNATPVGVPANSQTQSKTTTEMQLRATFVAAGSGGANTLAPLLRYQTPTPSAFLWGTPWRINTGTDYPRLLVL